MISNSIQCIFYQHANGEIFMNVNTRYCRLLALSLAIASIVVSRPVKAQLAPPTGPSYGGSVPASRKVVSGIAWYGVLKDGLAEAKRTGKPILLITSAAQCNGVPGMW
jgi:hypothetical protein